MCRNSYAGAVIEYDTPSDLSQAYFKIGSKYLEVHFIEGSSIRIDKFTDGKRVSSVFSTSEGVFACDDKYKGCLKISAHSDTFLPAFSLPFESFRFFKTSKSQIILGQKCSIYREEMTLPLNLSFGKNKTQKHIEYCVLSEKKPSLDSNCEQKKLAKSKDKKASDQIRESCKISYVLEVKATSIDGKLGSQTYIQRAKSFKLKKIPKEVFRLTYKLSSKIEM